MAEPDSELPQPESVSACQCNEGMSAHETSLLARVADLCRIIAAARTDITALGMADITRAQIPAAKDELDAVVSHTAWATDVILDTCETVDRFGGALDAATGAILQTATTRIYEACNFHDITGQRISKVVETLQLIDAKIAHIVAQFGDPAVGDATAIPTILRGPQLPGQAMRQHDIDALLARLG